MHCDPFHHHRLGFVGIFHRFVTLHPSLLPRLPQLLPPLGVLLPSLALPLLLQRLFPQLLELPLGLASRGALRLPHHTPLVLYHGCLHELPLQVGHRPSHLFLLCHLILKALLDLLRSVVPEADQVFREAESRPAHQQEDHRNDCRYAGEEQQHARGQANSAGKRFLLLRCGRFARPLRRRGRRNGQTLHEHWKRNRVVVDLPGGGLRSGPCHQKLKPVPYFNGNSRRNLGDAHSKKLFHALRSPKSPRCRGQNQVQAADLWSAVVLAPDPA
mmetsp:Transcript_12845/g.28907  ORF Transcript_12845/g.28907 Transcript_12845/m.28907 type:complete len:272 (-) Transcript_12845:724-1539(-)